METNNISYIGTFWVSIFRGSYMSVHVLLNLLNELGKDKIWGFADDLIGFPHRI